MFTGGYELKEDMDDTWASATRSQVATKAVKMGGMLTLGSRNYNSLVYDKLDTYLCSLLVKDVEEEVEHCMKGGQRSVGWP